MSKIINLQQRVDAAEQAFREVDEQHSSYTERLIELVEAVKSGLRQKLADMAQNQMEYERMTQDYQQLSDMLRSLMTAVEAGGRSRVSHMMYDLETKSAPSRTPAPEIATTPPASADSLRTREPASLPQDDGNGRKSEGDELMDYVDPESFRSGMQRVLKKKPRAASPKLTDLSDVPAT